MDIVLTKLKNSAKQTLTVLVFLFKDYRYRRTYGSYCTLRVEHYKLLGWRLRDFASKQIHIVTPILKLLCAGWCYDGAPQISPSQLDEIYE